MTPLQFSTLARLIYGDTWQTEMADYLQVSRRNVQHWAAGSKPIPAGVSCDVIECGRRNYRDVRIARARIYEIAEILRVITGAE